MEFPKGKLPPTGDRLKQLDRAQEDVATALQAAGQAVLELSKDKPSAKLAETHSQTFLTSLENVDRVVSQNLSYITQVSTGQAHEGSSYAAQQGMHMAEHRLKHCQTRLAELERLKNKQIQENKDLVEAQAKQNPEAP